MGTLLAILLPAFHKVNKRLAFALAQLKRAFRFQREDGDIVHRLDRSNIDRRARLLKAWGQDQRWRRFRAPD